MAEVVARDAPRVRSDQMARRFLFRRLGRIAPPYWIATFAMAVSIAALPTSMRESRLSADHLLASLAFFPWPNWKGEWLPVLDVGWTLTYEVLFYLLIATLLFIRSRNSVAIAAGIVAITGLAGWWLKLAMPFAVVFNPLLLEFGAGVCAWSAARRGALSKWVRIALIAFAAAALVITAVPSAMPLRALFWGLPAAVLVYAMAIGHSSSTMRELSWLHHPKRLLLLLGNASYSIYLFHVFVVKVFARAGKLLALQSYSVPSLLLLIVALVTSAIVGIVIYRWIEHPLLYGTYRLLRVEERQIEPTLAEP